MNHREARWIDIYFHNRDQFFVMNRNGAFGSAKRYFYRFYPTKYFNKWDALLELRKTEQETLDKPGDRCMMDEQPGLTQCITEHIERKIGCRYDKLNYST